MRNIRFARLLALATFILAATGSPPTALSAATRPAADDPLATAVAFDEAMRRGDLQVVQSLSLTTRDDHAELLKALVSWGETYSHLENAALKAFGEQGAAKIVRNDISLKLLRRGRASIDGDTAIVADVDGRERYWLVRRDGAWKVRTEQLSPMRDADIPRNVRTFVQAADANAQTSREIEAGKFKSVEEANAALKERMLARPTTVPSE